ncbi:hypothetical protein PNOK_0159000 [Pyrrhoderma noxium]|uniref:Uncharacterized protein n=1 Tax=Pyrrhoderma noxium TaxID=2282107 RepID=A0A286UPV3_9AGAM|nr:hypothetical protein PNOK_0159000 [Pyrrhoderma noxium]
MSGSAPVKRSNTIPHTTNKNPPSNSAKTSTPSSAPTPTPSSALVPAPAAQRSTVSSSGKAETTFRENNPTFRCKVDGKKHTKCQKEKMPKSWSSTTPEIAIYRALRDLVRLQKQHIERHIASLDDKIRSQQLRATSPSVISDKSGKKEAKRLNKIEDCTKLVSSYESEKKKVDRDLTTISSEYEAAKTNPGVTRFSNGHSMELRTDLSLKI